jgi:hypothetical protein
MAQVPQATREAGCLEGISSDTQWEFLELEAARHARMSGASRSQERDDFGANLREESKSPARVWGCSICAAPSARALVEPVGGLLFEGPSNHRVRRPSPSWPHCEVIRFDRRITRGVFGAAIVLSAR